MNEGLQLAILCASSDEQQFGVTLALCSRGMGTGGTVRSILTSLQASAEDGSAMARTVLSAVQTIRFAASKHGSGDTARTAALACRFFVQGCPPRG